MSTNNFHFHKKISTFLLGIKLVYNNFTKSVLTKFTYIAFSLLMLVNLITTINAQPKELLIAPTISLSKNVNALSLNVYYFNNIKDTNLSYYSAGAEINPFWQAPANSLLGLAKNINLAVDYNKNYTKSNNYSSVIHTLHADIKNSVINNKLINIYYGVSFGKTKYDSLIIDTTQIKPKSITQTLSSYSYFVGIDIGFFNVLPAISSLNFLQNINYLSNIYTTFEFRQYKLQKSPQIKYIDDYNYKVYNIGIKYKILLYNKYILK